MDSLGTGSGVQCSQGNDVSLYAECVYLCIHWPSCIRHFATPWNYPGQNTGVGSLSLLQGIIPTQGSNRGLSPTLQSDSLPAEPQGKPRKKEVIYIAEIS